MLFEQTPTPAVGRGSAVGDISAPGGGTQAGPGSPAAGGFPDGLEVRETTYGAACRLARVGFPVFPCRKGGKEPATPHGFKDATTSIDRLAEWWAVSDDGTTRPLNLGLPTGRPSGLWVLDVDGREGLETLGRLEQEHGPLPETVRVETPSGGVHFYFRLPEVEVRCKTRVLPGVDVRGEGGYVLVPPSVVDGRRYRWVFPGDPPPVVNLGENPELLGELLEAPPSPSVPLADAPGWLLELVVSRGRREPRPREAGAGAVSPPEGQRWPQGERNIRLFREGCALRRRGYSAAEIEAALLVLNAERCDPPLDEAEVEKIARNAARYEPEPGSEGGRRALEVVGTESVTHRPVEWLWEGRIPYGELTLLVGDPGVGKSLLTCWLAARVAGGGGYALLVSAEDDPARTIRPRLEAAGADLRKVGLLQARAGGVEDVVTLPADADRITNIVCDTGARLLVVDPLSAHLEESVNSWRDQSVRRALAPLARAAQTTGCAVVVVAHLNKLRGAEATYRVGGSIGIPAAARSVLLLARDPDDPDGDQRVLAHAKSNLAPLAASLALRVVAPPARGGQPRLEVFGEVDHSARDLLNEQAIEPAARDDAKEFLLEALADGPRPAKELFREAREAGVSEITLRRAAKTLGITRRRVSQRGGNRGGGWWEWALPPSAGGTEAVDQDDRDQDDQPHISQVIILNSPHENWDCGRSHDQDDHLEDIDHLDHLDPGRRGGEAPKVATPSRTDLRACAAHVDPEAPDNGFSPGCRYCVAATERFSAGVESAGGGGS